MSTSTTTPPAAAGAGPSINAPAGAGRVTPPPVDKVALGVQPGDVVLVLLEPGIRRPMMVTRIGPVIIHARQTPTAAAQSHDEIRASGVLFCEPEDHNTVALRTLGQDYLDPARIHGRPDRHGPYAYAENLAPGVGIGQWITRPTRLPGA